MKNDACIRFLQWALPRLHMRWPGFRKVRNQVCKRLARRLTALDLPDGDAYRRYLSDHPDEWQVLDSLCRPVVTRFYRDTRVFGRLSDDILPGLASAAQSVRRDTLTAWSIGSASGEEPYTLAILWHCRVAARFPGLSLSILGTEVGAHLLQPSAQACYPAGTIRNLPEELHRTVFSRRGDQYCLKPVYRQAVAFRQQDVRTTLPDGRFDLILCRNLVFTYFDEELQVRLLGQLLNRLRSGSWLVVGVRETLPVLPKGLIAVSERLGLYRYTGNTDGPRAARAVYPPLLHWRPNH